MIFSLSIKSKYSLQNTRKDEDNVKQSFFGDFLHQLVFLIHTTAAELYNLGVWSLKGPVGDYTHHRLSQGKVFLLFNMDDVYFLSTC